MLDEAIGMTLFHSLSCPSKCPHGISFQEHLSPDGILINHLHGSVAPVSELIYVSLPPRVFRASVILIELDWMLAQSKRHRWVDEAALARVYLPPYQNIEAEVQKFICRNLSASLFPSCVLFRASL